MGGSKTLGSCFGVLVIMRAPVVLGKYYADITQQVKYAAHGPFQGSCKPRGT